MLVSSGGRIAYGWAKPVPVNPMVFRNPRRGVFLVSIAGPVSNILLALLAGVILRVIWSFTGSPRVASPLEIVLYYVVSLNLFLAFFNLIPIPPLDGSGVVASLLPVEYAIKYERMGRMGMFVIFALIILGSFMGFSIIGAIIMPPAYGLFYLFTGHQIGR